MKFSGGSGLRKSAKFSSELANHGENDEFSIFNFFLKILDPIACVYEVREALCDTLRIRPPVCLL